MFRGFGADFHLGVKLALKARFTTLTLWLIAIVVLVAVMAAQFSGRQPATVALDVGLSVIRLGLPLLIVLMAQELISREFDRRYFLSSLSYPRPRRHFLLARLATLLSLSGLQLLLAGAALAATVKLIGTGYAQATPVALGPYYILTLTLSALDLFTLAALATLLAVVASTPSFVLIGTMGFMVVARSYATIISLLQQEQELVAKQELYQSSLALLRFLLPDLAALDVRIIALYGQIELLPANLGMTVLSAIIYAVALVFVSLWALNRKQFN